MLRPAIVALSRSAAPRAQGQLFTLSRAAKGVVQRRAMSTSKEASHSPIDLAKKYAPQIAVGAGVLVVTYGIAKSFYSVTTGILSLDMYDVFRYGFVTGALCVGAFGGGAFWLRRMSRISPERAFKKALARVQASPAAQKALGSPTLKSGQLRAYTLEGGHVSFGKKMAWVEPRAQLLFQVVGEASGKEGMVTAEAVQHKNGIVLNLLALVSSSARLINSEKRASSL
jgi:hypothetical protein